MRRIPPDFDANKIAHQLIQTFQSSEQYAYLALTPERRIRYISPNLGDLLQVAFLESFLDQPITNLFGELVGADDIFIELIAGTQKLYRLENVARKQADEQIFYITLHLVLLDSLHPEAGFLLTVEDSSQVGHLQQTLIQQRNELKREVSRREMAEQALQQLNEELEERIKRRAAELAVANEQLRLLEAAIVNTSDTVVIAQIEPEDLLKTRIVYTNDALTSKTGYQFHEVEGQPYHILYGPNTNLGQLEKIKSALANRESIHVELIKYRKDGTEFWVDMTVAPILNDKNELTHFVSIERDATERKKLESTLRQAQKMEAVGLLAGGIAHDFNNMLTIIMSYSDLLLRYFPENPQVIKYAKPINTAGKRASDLTYQLLAFSRRQVLQIETVNLNDVIAEVEAMIRGPIGEDIQFTTLLNPDLWSIEADPSQLSQVLINLIVNARDAMPQGGSLTIDAANVTLEKKDGRITPELDVGNYVCLTVKDNGKGMEHEVIKQIFDPFFTTKEKGKGTGLGLSTAYGIIAQSNGGIAVQSKVGVGTIFKIFLPRSDSVDYQDQTADESPPLQMQDAATILLVEDEDGVRELIEEGLKFHGYQIIVAKNGAEALAIYKAASHSIDLLLTDVVMPKMSGHELTQKITAINPSIKTLYITGYTDARIMDHGIGKSATNLLQKPFTIGKLIDKIASLLDKDK